MAMTVIELGLVADGDDQSPFSGAPRRWSRAELRRVLVALVAVLCLLTLTGSVRPDRRGITELWSMPFTSGVDSYTVAGDAAYVLSPGASTLSAYDLRTGALRWARPVDGDTSVDWVPGEGVLLSPAGATAVEIKQPDGSVISHQYSRDTVAIDAADGRQLWRRPGQLEVVAGDRLVLTELDATGSRVRAVRVVALRTGDRVFAPPTAGLANWTVESPPDGSPADRMVTATADGLVRVLDLADGRLVASGRLPWQRESDNQGNGTFLTLTDHHLFTERVGNGKSTVDAYDTETLRPLWQAKTSGSGYFTGCGPVLCRSDETGTTAGYDRDTGALRWRITGGLGNRPLPGGRMVMEGAMSGDRTRQYLLDAGNGRTLADLGQAMPVWTQPVGAAPYLLAHTLEPAGQMSVSRLEPRTGAVRLLGVITPVDLDCQAAGSLLACVTMDRRLAVMDAG
jgi:outer membrane protein assembly factor BamB